ncbi:hypothetical protein QJS10_CPA03g01836 [Acorus calamus]|uniref:Uncharacterized protein n=1 Tax=Acorus calamus TaxID=4465 RepID=A0AAV9FC76_ACOCL|nr:hypothetical protein QJS10_CPA03g01836 [Acorus calamus]
MCYEVKCSTCGKSTWGGCGRHVESVHKKIPQGQHCLCRGWPGVKAVTDGSDGGAVSADAEPKAASTCVVL